MHTFPLRAALWGAALVLFTTSAAAQGRTPRDYRLAVGLIQRGLHAEAAQKLRAFLDEHPRHEKASEAWYRLGTCEVENAKPEAAAQAFERALRDEDLPLRPECRYRLGTVLQQLGRRGDAVQQLDALPREHGDDHYLAAAAYYAAGECLRDEGEDAAALQRFAKAAEVAGDDKDLVFSGLYQAGFVQLRLGQNREAHATFAALARGFPDHQAIGEIRYLEGEAAYRDGLLQPAESAWRAAVDHGGPFVDDALSGLAWCRVKGGDPEAALRLFRRLVDEHPDSELVPRAQLEVGRLLVRGAEHQDAAKTLRTLLARDGLADDVRAAGLELRGLALLALGEAEDAQADFERAIGTVEAAATGPRLHFNLGDSFAKREEWEEALSSYEKAAATDDPALRGDALYAQALALHKLGRYAESAQRARTLLKELPEHRLVPLARFSVAENQFAAEQYAEALASYDGLGAEHPQATDAAFKAAWAAYLAGDAAEGARRFAALADDRAQSDGHREEALSMLALAHYEAGDHDAALAAADRYLARHAEGRFLARTEQIAGRVLKQQGDLQAAARRLSRAAKAETGARASEVALEQADVLFERGDFAAAGQIYGSLTGGPPKVAVRALEGLAWSAFELGEDAACEESASRALASEAVGDRAPDLLELLVNLKHRQERWDDAARIAQRFLDGHGDHPRAAELRYALGVSLARGGHDERAVQTLESVAAESVARPDLLHYELAWAARRAGDEAKALGGFARVAAITEDEDLAGEAHLHLGEAALGKGEHGRAREHFAKVRGRYRGRAIYRTGHAWVLDDQLAEAAAAFEQVAALGPDQPLRHEAHFMAGEARLRSGDPERAAPSLRALLEAVPDHERAQRARLYLGECAVRIGEPAEAIGRLAEYLQNGAEEADVAKARAHLWLGKARQAREEHGAAEQQLQKVADFSEGELAAEAWFRIGECRRSAGDLPGAAAAFVNLSILYAQPTWVARGLFEAGACYESLGQKDKAMKFFRELVERFPDSEPGKRARERIGD